MLFEEAFEEYKIYASKRHKKQSFDTIRINFNNHILPYFKDKLINELTKNDIILWQNTIINKNFSNNFNSLLYCIFSSFLEYCILIDKLDFNIVRSVGNFPKRFESKNYDVYTLSEFRHFRNNVDNFIYRQYFNFMYFYGSRPSEAIALRFSDLEGSILHIRHNMTRRGKRCLDTPKNASSIRDLHLDFITRVRFFILKCYYEKNYGYGNYDYFIFGGLKPLATTSIDRYKHKACLKAHIREIKTHGFRHSYATRMIHKGVPIDVVSRNMGHSKVTTTLDVYLHKEKRAIRPIFVRFHFFNTIRNNFKKISQSIITHFIV